MRVAVLTLLVIGCGGGTSGDPLPDARVEASADADASACTGSSCFDAPAPAECPATLPAEGAACAVAAPCFYEVDACDSPTASCEAGVWRVRHTSCVNRCPLFRPAEGAACDGGAGGAAVPEGMVCEFGRYPESACSRCRCQSGVWRCGEACTQACAPGAACVETFGCGLGGKCDLFCWCVGSKLECAAHPC